MNNPLESIPVVVLIVGILVILALLTKCLLKRIRIPDLIGFLILGFLLRLGDSSWSILGERGFGILEFLASVGVFALLFRIGLESDLPALIRQLGRAKFTWLGDFLMSGCLGFVAAYFLLGLPLLACFFVGAALTATSVGVTVTVWKQAKALRSDAGELLVDVAEMDDISGVVVMAFLFAIAPILIKDTGDAPILPLLARTGTSLVATLGGFGLLCFLFSQYVEHHITRFYQRIVSPPDPMILVTGTGIIIAAVAGILGLSIAIGAFFAGLAFSRDPRAVRMEGSFNTLYEFFTPFFFIGIGAQIEPGSLGTGLGAGLVLFLAAVLGKTVGAGGPTLATMGWTSAVLIGASMVPRAEICLIIMKHGVDLGSAAVPPQAYAAIVVVSALTCLLAPLLVLRLLERWPQKEGRG